MTIQEEFMAACESGNLESVELLLKNPRFDVNKADQEGKTPFYRACENGHMEVIEHLLKDPRINVNQANKEGDTPFSTVCGLNNMKVVELLLKDPRINTNQPDNKGITPFYLVCESGDLEVVEFLLKDPRINTNQPDNKGITPFYIACKYGNMEVVELLLKDPRININQPDNKGKTPFYLACEKGDLEVVELLLQDPRVEVNKSNNNGQTPFSVIGSGYWLQSEDLGTKVVEIRTMILANAFVKASEEQIRGFDPNESFNENLLRFSKAVGLVGGNANSNLFNGVTPEGIIQELEKIKSHQQEIADERASGTFALMILHCNEFLSLKETDNQANSTLKQDKKGLPSTSPRMTIGRATQAINAMKQFSQTH